MGWVPGMADEDGPAFGPGIGAAEAVVVPGGGPAFGPGNPLGARAMYLGSTVYRIHGTNQPSTIGKFVSSGCIGMLNEDVSDLFDRVKVGTRVVVMPGNPPAALASAQAVPGPNASGPNGGPAYGGPSAPVPGGVQPTVVPPLPAPVTVR